MENMAEPTRSAPLVGWHEKKGREERERERKERKEGKEGEGERRGEDEGEKQAANAHRFSSFFQSSYHRAIAEVGAGNTGTCPGCASLSQVGSTTQSALRFSA